VKEKNGRAGRRALNEGGAGKSPQLNKRHRGVLQSVSLLGGTLQGKGGASKKKIEKTQGKKPPKSRVCEGITGDGKPYQIHLDGRAGKKEIHGEKNLLLERTLDKSVLGGRCLIGSPKGSEKSY